MSWKKQLPKPISLNDGRELRTLSDIGELILRLPETVQETPKWTYATELLVQAAETGKYDHVAAACDQLMRAALTDGYVAPTIPPAAERPSALSGEAGREFAFADGDLAGSAPVVTHGQNTIPR